MSVDMDDRFRVDKNEKRNCPSKKKHIFINIKFYQLIFYFQRLFETI